MRYTLIDFKKYLDDLAGHYNRNAIFYKEVKGNIEQSNSDDRIKKLCEHLRRETENIVESKVDDNMKEEDILDFRNTLETYYFYHKNNYEYQREAIKDLVEAEKHNVRKDLCKKFLDQLDAIIEGTYEES